jgi:hypothetical protein
MSSRDIFGGGEYLGRGDEGEEEEGRKGQTIK